MTIQELAEKIGIPYEELKLDYDIEDMVQEYYHDRVKLFSRLTERIHYREKVLQLFLTLATHTYKRYDELGIEEQVFIDTMKDITIWAENCYKQCGIYGIQQHRWLQNHIDMKLFRLGRLQFEPISVDRDIEVDMPVAKGCIALNVHIPQGEPLTYEACQASYQEAQKFFRGMTKVYLCHSWLLQPILSEILPVDSNIVRFQSDYKIYEIDHNDRQCEERVFGRELDQPKDYEAHTSLQKSVKKVLVSGRKMGTAYGIFQLD